MKFERIVGDVDVALGGAGSAERPSLTCGCREDLLNLGVATDARTSDREYLWEELECSPSPPRESAAVMDGRPLKGKVEPAIVDRRLGLEGVVA